MVLHYQCTAHGYMGGRADFGTRNLTGYTTDGITEGSTNQYFTNARARSAISVSGDLSYNSSTGVISFSETTAATTRALISVTDAGGDGSLTYNETTGIITYTGPSASEVRSHFSASGDLSYDSSTGVFSFDVEDVYTKSNFDSDWNQALDEAHRSDTSTDWNLKTLEIAFDRTCNFACTYCNLSLIHI